MRPLPSTVPLLTLVVALTARAAPQATLSAQQEAFALHHAAALRGLAAVQKISELRSAARGAAAPAPTAAPTTAAPTTTTAAPTTTTARVTPLAELPQPEVWRQFVLNRMTTAIEIQRAMPSPSPGIGATLEPVPLTQQALERLLAESLSGEPTQTGAPWHRSAALQLRTVMEADNRLEQAQQPGVAEPGLVMARAIADVSATRLSPEPISKAVPPLTRPEIAYIRDLLEEAVDGDLILPV
ncbi:uncharacterized protein LOC122386315 [Amphibalanus amphitrite]|uniref:uncharacterized protein LOC122386315 n=1 Tax=Amphibalanus amphitrite TaxID=1232801 RepID=UPI001C90D58D|nr:uncharacterized protein LOC122386315 [Amphibalanus amphitrite]